MGAALMRAAQWTTAGSGTGKLEITPLNESLLKEIIKYVENFSTRHPQEAALVFKEPLGWTTTLEPSAFGPDYEISKSTVNSKETAKDGQPLLNLSSHAIQVYSFSQLSNILELAQDKKLKEVRACLEANRDPVAKILGPSFATVEGEDTSMLRLLDKVKEGGEGHEAELKMKMLLLLQQLDMQLLNNSLKQMSQEVRLSPVTVKNDVELLKRFCGEGEKMVLKSVEYTSDYEFSNGCRAAPWRQVHGEICYLVIKPIDTDPLYITCSTAGVFLNGGAEKEREEIDYERKSEVYKDLVTLLKNKSPHFAENITKQDFAIYEEPPSTQKTQHVELVDTEEQGQTKRSYENQEKNVHEKMRQQPTQKKPTPPKKLEPSLKWKNLNLTSSQGKTPGARDEDFSESSSESEEDEDQPDRRQESNTDLPSEYWQIQKLVKYLKARIADGDKAPLLDAPITPGHTFGPAVDDLLQHSHRVWEFTKELVCLLPKRPPPVCRPMPNWRPRFHQPQRPAQRPVELVRLLPKRPPSVCRPASNWRPRFQQPQTGTTTRGCENGELQ
ncbi:UNVERIFIED_CONTAM: hypothetical protein FKN15_041898 [Acipenser sinensis]